MSFDSFLADILATVIGGMLLTLLFFIAKEKLFSIADVNGVWYLEMETINTAYNPYKGMILGYIIIIWREGNSIKGTAEKIYENSSTGNRTYEGKNRTRGIIEGFVEKKYLGKDRIFLHVVENGHGRESTNFYDFIVKSNALMFGKFNSMVANQDGIVRLQREPF